MASWGCPMAANGATPVDPALPQNLLNVTQGIFGPHPGYRTTHAKGLLVQGTFTSSPQARTLSTAAHFNSSSTPVIARFSVGGGLPHVSDVDDAATPKGLAVRFQIPDGTSTDLISHSFNGFAAKNGEDLLIFFGLFSNVAKTSAALEKAKAGQGDFWKAEGDYLQATTAFEAFLATHPPAAGFMLGAKPNPVDYGTLTYYEPNTHVLTNAAGKVSNVRYRFIPAAGEHLYPDDGTLGNLDPNYLNDDLLQRFPAKPIVFNIWAHVAGPTDVLDDATVLYQSTTLIPLGQLVINGVVADNANQTQQIAFSPVPETGGIKGIASSTDPLIQTRKGVYGLSATQRRGETRVE